MCVMFLVEVPESRSFLPQDLCLAPNSIVRLHAGSRHFKVHRFNQLSINLSLLARISNFQAAA